MASMTVPVCYKCGAELEYVMFQVNLLRGEKFWSCPKCGEARTVEKTMVTKTPRVAEGE